MAKYLDGHAHPPGDCCYTTDNIYPGILQLSVLEENPKYFTFDLTFGHMDHSYI